MISRDEVRQAIHAAFGRLPVPDPATLLRGDIAEFRDESGAEAIRSALAGRPWPSLTPEFLAARWSSFGYLSPEGYRYYLPALLTAALRGRSDPSETLLHSTTFALQPSFWALYYEGDDRPFRARQAAFTAAQYDAVCAFLGVVFAEGRLRHLAAKAVRWGWSQRETPVRDAVTAYYRTLYSFSYAEPEDPDEPEEAVGLFREIVAAFADTPYPGDDRLCGSAQGDEPAEYAMEFRGVRWQNAHPDFLAYQYPALSFFSHAGFRYFLPAFLVAEICGYDSNADLLFHLTHGLGRADAAERFAAFTGAERAAIVRFLRYRRIDGDSFFAPDIRRALDDYWLPSLRGSSA